MALDCDGMKLVEIFYMNSTDGIFIVDKEGKVVLVNPAILTMLGTSYKELVGVYVSEILKNGIYTGAPSLKALETKKSFTGLVKARNGTEIMSTSKPIFDENGELQWIITNCRPLSVVDTFYEEYVRETGKQDVKDHYLSKLEREFVYHSPLMKKLMEQVEIVARSECTVIIYGETGTGKGLLAQYIHDKSPRRTKRLIEINCAAIPDNLIESELFGYEKGAFTGASTEGKLGLFEVASGGTLLLDEIGEMPMHLQAKLLKVLDAGYILRVGGTVHHKVNTRVLVATNQNLKKLVREGKFREDLFYRLNVVPITMPPLSSRKEDIVHLAERILAELNQKYGGEKEISEKTMKCLEQYDWPGNVRQLRNVIERLYIMSPGKQLTLASEMTIKQDEDIYTAEDSGRQRRRKVAAEVKQTEARTVNDSAADNGATLRDYLAETEKEYIFETLSACGGSVPEAAKRLGVHRTSLYKKLNEYGG
ncbi:sigma-54 interaction domain-containing protein [Bacilliculturomica massiliensis]|uniref:sigma-54 interaction domain-containing protein n=1 Tax=Bacilliculturomica massiliensis TaxID=1917867 RepID=UPI00102FABE3|nr:sigma 54-interacting transcriptional regulator [Bacilliculturomica massiliensis]